MPKLFDLVKVNIAATGTGTVTFGSVFSPEFFTPSEVGAVDGDTVRYVLIDGTDIELGTGVIGGSVTTMTRTVTRSRVGGVAGTSKLNLSGTAYLALTAAAADILNPADPALPVVRFDAAQTLNSTQKAQVLANIGDTRDTPRILTVSTAVSTIDVTGIDVIQYTSASSTTITSMSGIIVGKTYVFQNMGTGVLTISRSFAVLYGSANAVLNQHYCLPVIGRHSSSIHALGPVSTNG